MTMQKIKTIIDLKSSVDTKNMNDEAFTIGCRSLNTSNVNMSPTIIKVLFFPVSDSGQLLLLFHFLNEESK